MTTVLELFQEMTVEDWIKSCTQDYTYKNLINSFRVHRHNEIFEVAILLRPPSVFENTEISVKILNSVDKKFLFINYKEWVEVYQSSFSDQLARDLPIQNITDAVITMSENTKDQREKERSKYTGID